MLETVILIRNIFYKCFAVSLFYYLLITVLYITNIDWLATIMNTYYRVSPNETYILCGHYMALVEIITFNILLMPALGLHWATCALKKQKK